MRDVDSPTSSTARDGTARADNGRGDAGREDTPARLVAAAEQLFADGGEEAMSLRAVSRAARSNAAAVHYHFGGRDELLRAVIARHLEPRHTRRLALLDEARQAYGDAVPVTAIVAAVVRPDLELLAALRPDRVRVARLLGRAPGLAAAGTMLQRQADALDKRIRPLLRTALPEMPVDELRQRAWLLSATTTSILAGAPDPGDTGPLGSDDLEEQVARLVAFGAAGMRRPAVDLRALRRVVGAVVGWPIRKAG